VTNLILIVYYYSQLTSLEKRLFVWISLNKTQLSITSTVLLIKFCIIVNLCMRKD